MQLDRIRQIATSGFVYAQDHRYAGADPYDGLLAPFASLLKTRRTRQIWVQLNKRGGHFSRRVTNVPPVRMAKGIALFAEAARHLGNHDIQSSLIDELVRINNGGPWGYEFDVQTRWAHYKAGTPNVVATAFVLRALAHAGRLNEVRPQVADWLESQAEGLPYFRYTASSDSLIHNGNLLAAESLARLRPEATVITTAVQTSIASQQPQGLWDYGVGRGLAWKDNFHTIYQLDSLRSLLARDMARQSVYQRAVEGWLAAFFLPDRTPKFLSTSRSHSTDIHTVATVVSGLIDHAPHRDDLLDASVQILIGEQQRDGSFRKSRFRPVLMRWEQAHAVRAIAKFAEYKESR